MDLFHTMDFLFFAVVKAYILTQRFVLNCFYFLWLYIVRQIFLSNAKNVHEYSFYINFLMLVRNRATSNWNTSNLSKFLKDFNIFSIVNELTETNDNDS